MTQWRALKITISSNSSTKAICNNIWSHILRSVTFRPSKSSNKSVMLLSHSIKKILYTGINNHIQKYQTFEHQNQRRSVQTQRIQVCQERNHKRYEICFNCWLFLALYVSANDKSRNLYMQTRCLGSWCHLILLHQK